MVLACSCLQLVAGPMASAPTSRPSFAGNARVLRPVQKRRVQAQRVMAKAVASPAQPKTTQDSKKAGIVSPEVAKDL